ncbi:hypothetical protein [Rhizobium halophilum]|uniref:hypothetical protein n=1 Tax=Rhizobium halophilum TaxID=2846852 RepID=UPI001EFDAC32|nr:hypothetical protein [Rhizobium halophilum]MCF6371341.1 hypothetical protein [Rhizobium halophilum]
MTKTLNIAFLAVTLIAGAAHAEGDYYQGASKNRSAQVDMTTTGSVEVAYAFKKTSRDDRKINDSGDYYDGVSRAN